MICSSTYINLTQSLKKNTTYLWFISKMKLRYWVSLCWFAINKMYGTHLEIQKIDSVWQSIENCSTLKYDICRLLHWNFHNWVSTWCIKGLFGTMQCHNLFIKYFNKNKNILSKINIVIYFVCSWLWHKNVPYIQVHIFFPE